MNWENIQDIIKKFENEYIRILLYGQPGTGKTTFPFTIYKNKTIAVTLHEEMSPAEILGFYIPKGNEFQFKPGPGTLALKQGLCLVLNEIDKSSNSIFTILLNLLDDINILKVYLPNDEVITPQPGYKVIATMNGSPDDLPPALLDRFDLKFHIEKPHPLAIEKIKNNKIKELVLESYEHLNNKKSALTMREAIAIDRLLNKEINEELAFKSVLNEEKFQELYNSYQLI